MTSKLVASEQQLKQANESVSSLRVAKEKLDGQYKVVSEQLELVQNSHEQMASKKQNETELMSKEINLNGVKMKDMKSQLLHTEKELGETRDSLRTVS